MPDQIKLTFSDGEHIITGYIIQKSPEWCFGVAFAEPNGPGDSPLEGWDFKNPYFVYSSDFPRELQQTSVDFNMAQDLGVDPKFWNSSIPAEAARMGYMIAKYFSMLAAGLKEWPI